MTILSNTLKGLHIIGIWQFLATHWKVCISLGYDNSLQHTERFAYHWDMTILCNTLKGLHIIGIWQFFATRYWCHTELWPFHDTQRCSEVIIDAILHDNAKHTLIYQHVQDEIEIHLKTRHLPTVKYFQYQWLLCQFKREFLWVDFGPTQGHLAYNPAGCKQHLIDICQKLLT